MAGRVTDSAADSSKAKKTRGCSCCTEWLEWNKKSKRTNLTNSDWHATDDSLRITKPSKINNNHSFCDPQLTEPLCQHRQSNDPFNLVVSMEHSDARHTPSFRSTTFMLLVISFYMIASTMLGGFVYLIDSMSPKPQEFINEDEIETNPEWCYFINTRIVKTIADEIALSYYAFGFIIYYTTGSNFRRQIHYMLGKVCVRCGCRCTAFQHLYQSEDTIKVSTVRRSNRPRGQLNKFSLDDDRKNFGSPEMRLSTATTSTRRSSHMPFNNLNSVPLKENNHQLDRDQSLSNMHKLGLVNREPRANNLANNPFTEKLKDIRHMDSDGDIVT